MGILEKLLNLSKGYFRRELRTSANNQKALRLYESFGFSQAQGPEIVFNRRQNQKIRSS